MNIPKQKQYSHFPLAMISRFTIPENLQIKFQ